MRWAGFYLCTLLGAQLLDVGYAPDSDQVLHRSEMSRCAINGLMRRSKRHLYSITLSARPSSGGGGLPYESHRLQASRWEGFRVRGAVMIRATVLRALVLMAAFAAGLTPVTCLGENSNRLPTKATKELPPELLSLLRQKKMPKYSPIVVRVSRKRRSSKSGNRTPPAFSRSSRSIRSVGGRATLGRSCRRATGRLQRDSIQLHPS